MANIYHAYLKLFLIKRLFRLMVPVLIVTGCGGQPSEEQQPDPSETIEFEFAVAAAHPMATEAGYQIIQKGGSAVDAAIAVQMVLTLVEPQSSGIGGGAFLMHWDGDQVTSYDGREIAPSGADINLFLDENGETIPFDEAVHSGLSVGVPGLLAMLHKAHGKYGKLPWEALFRPAISIAEQGFAITPRLHRQLLGDERLRQDDIARALYYDDDGEAHPEGYLLKNPALAEILLRISEAGPDAFYHGNIAESIVERVQNHHRSGTMTAEDLARYPESIPEREAICTPWKTYEICGFPPPSSGHLTIMQILGIMEHLDPPTTVMNGPVPSAGWLHRYIESSKLAFADRNRYIADPDFVDPPGDGWESLLIPEYLKKRSALITDMSMGQADAGDPGSFSSGYGNHPEQPDAGTSHISIIDREGRAVAMTTTIEQPLGSRIMTDGGTGLPGGFLLNNQLTDFSFAPRDDDGRPIANRVEPGKRPRSSMSPTLVIDRYTGEPVAVTGSPGGAAIIHYTAKSLIAMFDFGLDPQAAINLPNFANYNGPTYLEDGKFPAEVIHILKQKGHEIEERSLTSGLHIIRRADRGYIGGADPRREGVMMGE